MGYCPDIKSAYCERNNLGDIVKPHKHAAIIKKWADGAGIQIKSRIDGRWIDVDGGAPYFDIEREYRVKPETVRYRVALMRGSGRGSTATAHDDSYADFLQDHANFVRWLAPWQEVEV